MQEGATASLPIKCSEPVCACVVRGSTPDQKDRWRLACLSAARGMRPRLDGPTCAPTRVTEIVGEMSDLDRCIAVCPKCHEVVPTIFTPASTTPAPSYPCQIACADGTLAHSDRDLSPLLCTQLTNAVCGNPTNSAGGLGTSWIVTIVVLIVVACGIVGIFVYAHLHPNANAQAVGDAPAPAAPRAS